MSWVGKPVPTFPEHAPGSSQRALKRTLRGSWRVRPGPAWPRYHAISGAAFTRNGEYSVAEMRLRRREGCPDKRLPLCLAMRWLAAFAQSLQICIKCGSFKFSEKMRLIRIE